MPARKAGGAGEDAKCDGSKCDGPRSTLSEDVAVYLGQGYSGKGRQVAAGTEKFGRADSCRRANEEKTRIGSPVSGSADPGMEKGVLRPCGSLPRPPAYNPAERGGGRPPAGCQRRHRSLQVALSVLPLELLHLVERRNPIAGVAAPQIHHQEDIDLEVGL